MIATITTNNGLTGDRYTVETDALGIRVEHEIIDATGHAEIGSMATLMITAEAAPEVLRAIQRAAREVRL